MHPSHESQPFHSSDPSALTPPTTPPNLVTPASPPSAEPFISQHRSKNRQLPHCSPLQSSATFSNLPNPPFLLPMSTPERERILIMQKHRRGLLMNRRPGHARAGGFECG